MSGIPTPDLLIRFSLICFVPLFTWLLQPRIGVRDVDAYATAVGAFSIQAGQGYRSFTGEAFNHWPPGYSLILSLFSSPLSAALWINYLSLGATAALLYLLTLKSGWHRYACFGLAFSLAVGPFRELATGAKPDILTYALFLGALLLYRRPDKRGHSLSYWVWIALIPLKLITLIIAPAALLADVFSEEPSRRPTASRIVILTAVWGSAILGIALFNYLAVREIVPSSIRFSAPADLFKSILAFFYSIFRFSISHWYGSLQPQGAFFFFLIPLALSLTCLRTLRFDKSRPLLARFGLFFLLLMWVFRLFWNFDTGFRLSGYGLLPLLLAFRPAEKRRWLWLLYAAASLVTAGVNSLTTNAYGANDPRYERLCRSLSSAGLPSGIVFTNSFHLLDLHSKHPSVPVEKIQQLETLPEGSLFLRVTLPNKDPLATPVWDIPEPDGRWERLLSVEGAVLYRKTLPAGHTMREVP